MPNFENEHTAGATGQQGMLIPPGHLIPPQSLKRSCCSAFNLYFVLWIVDGLLLNHFFNSKFVYR